MLAIVTVDSFGYKLTFLLHVLSFIVAFAPAFVHPVLTRRVAGAEGDGGSRRLWGHMATNDLRVYAPALVATGFFGILLIVQSEDVISFADPWVSAAFLVWFLMIGVLVGLLVPAERRQAAGEAGAERLVRAFGGAIRLLLVVMLFLMIWQPGR
ncbi:hypothetical protein BH24ACT3_BH24ACT3_15860 [soil metagenome]